MRGRLVAADYGAHRDAVALALRCERAPEVPFRVARFTARNGRDEAGVLLLGAGGWSWRGGAMTVPLSLPVSGAWLILKFLPRPGQLTVEVGGKSAKVPLAAAPTGLQICGGTTAAPTEILIGDFVFVPA